MKIAKSIIKKCKDDVNLGLLAYRTTSLENRFTPAELMFSRKIHSRVPMLPNKLSSFNKVIEKKRERKEKQESNYNRRRRARKLSELNINDTVWVIDFRVHMPK